MSSGHSHPSNPFEDAPTCDIHAATAVRPGESDSQCRPEHHLVAGSSVARSRHRGTESTRGDHGGWARSVRVELTAYGLEEDLPSSKRASTRHFVHAAAFGGGSCAGSGIAGQLASLETEATRSGLTSATLAQPLGLGASGSTMRTLYRL